jgi:tetratricopeptide (TPR) repeat protein
VNGTRGRTPWRLALAAALALWIGAAALRAEPDEGDPRMDEAGSLLGSPESYPEAIELYRAVLRERPEHRAARLQLARVLGWSRRYDESLAEFAELIRAHPDDASLVVERSEVLSWSGRLDEARAGFEAVLAADPKNARAARGIARCYAWAGKHGRADRAYARALALADDGEARAEWERLRAPLRPRVELRASYFADSGDVDRDEVGLVYSGFQSVETRLSARLATIRVAHPQQNVTPRAQSRHDEDRAYELGVGMDRGLDGGTRLSAEAGARDWTYAGDSLFARGHLEHTFEGVGTLGLHLVHEDYADVSNSYEAVSNEIHHTAAAASFYRQVTARVGAFARVDVGRISDSNTRQSASASVSYVPWSGTDLDLSLGASYLSYGSRSDFYYDPESDLGVEALVEHRVPLTPALRFEYLAALGFQSTDEDGASESGTLWAARAGLRYERGPWLAFVRYGTSYSQRSSRYHYQTGELRIERKF